MPLLLKRVAFKLRRSMWRLITTIHPRRVHTFTLPDGLRFDYPLRTAVGEYLYAGWFEPGEVAFVRQHLKAGDVVLDVGANAGLYTLIAARAVGQQGHVYAFEPDDRAVALLRTNVALNGLTNVTVIEAAVSNETGQRAFAAAADSAMSSFADIGRDDQQIEKWRTVETIRLDDAMERFRIAAVTFVKIDVEGAEKLVLEGSTALLSCAPKGLTILFEAFDQNTIAFGYTVRDLLETLRCMGFSLHGFAPSLDLREIGEFGPEIGKTVYNFVAFKE